MTRVCFGVLAHNEPDCLADLVRNLQNFDPDCIVVLYNGGLDRTLGTNLGIPICPFSAPLRWGKLESFLFETIKWLHREQMVFDYLVTLDSDMLLMKPGFSQFLDIQMQDADYMAPNLQMILPDTQWVTGKRFLGEWVRVWQPILGLEHPYGCHNPLQVFSRKLVSDIATHAQLPLIEETAQSSQVRILEELLFPTMVYAMGFKAKRNPGSRSVRVDYFTVQEFKGLLADPDVFFIHPVPMELQAPERRAIRHLRTSPKADVTQFFEGIHHRHKIPGWARS